jgi:hypothetical protein
MKLIRILLAYILGFTVMSGVAGAKNTPTDFDNKYFVVASSGLAIGTCNMPCSESDTLCGGKLLPTLAVRIDGSNVEFHQQSGFLVCHDVILPTPVAVGTVLLSTKSSVDKHEGRYCLLLQTVFPVTVTRGVGAFAHSSMEHGAMSLRIHLDDPTKVELIGPALGKWLTQTDSLTSAVALSAKLNHLTAEKSVKQIRVGMTFEEVENVLGVPDTRVDLDHKVLFKYATLTVTFQDGKVIDVQ